ACSSAGRLDRRRWGHSPPRHPPHSRSRSSRLLTTKSAAGSAPPAGLTHTVVIPTALAPRTSQRRLSPTNSTSPGPASNAASARRNSAAEGFALRPSEENTAARNSPATPARSNSSTHGPFFDQ